MQRFSQSFLDRRFGVGFSGRAMLGASGASDATPIIPDVEDQLVDDIDDVFIDDIGDVLIAEAA